MLLGPLLAALASAPSSVTPPARFETAFDYTVASRDDSDAQFVAYDRDGEVIGVVAIWIDERGRIHLSSDYTDGYGETVIDGDDVELSGTLPADTLAVRADIVIGGVYEKPSWFRCGVAAGISFGTCAATGAVLVACPFAAMQAACECLPLTKWFENKRCPGHE